MLCIPFPGVYSWLWIISPNHHGALEPSLLSERVRALIVSPFFLFLSSSIFYSPLVNGRKAVGPPLVGFTPDLMVLGRTAGILLAPCIRHGSPEKQDQ